MSPELVALLICPNCRHSLRIRDEKIDCESCGAAFRFQNGIPVFFSESVEVAPAEHESNALGLEFEEILRRGEGLTLHLGAGATAVRHRNCIEFEHKIFRHTDVVGDAHALPFRNEIFDRVFAFNVFEHLRQPALAASEIHRVLKPGAALVIHTAFLQPLHEAPHHYYNATEYGVREWFGEFEIQTCEVSANFSPGFMLGFLAASVLNTVRGSELTAAEQTQIAETRLVEWAEFWRRKSEPPPGLGALLSLPQQLQKQIAAGFELRAHKPRHR